MGMAIARAFAFTFNSALQTLADEEIYIYILSNRIEGDEKNATQMSFSIDYPHGLISSDLISDRMPFIPARQAVKADQNPDCFPRRCMARISPWLR